MTPQAAAGRGGVAVAAVLLATLTISQRGQEEATRAELVRRWESSGAAARHPSAAERSRRDPDVAAARLALARALLAESFQTRRLAELPPAEAAAEARQAEANLELAATEAAAVLADPPGGLGSGADPRRRAAGRRRACRRRRDLPLPGSLARAARARPGPRAGRRRARAVAGDRLPQLLARPQ
jgi:hypothetical protein